MYLLSVQVLLITVTLSKVLNPDYLLL